MRVKDGIAEVRVGATLLYDSDPDEEERETHLKASAFLDALRRPARTATAEAAVAPQPGSGKRILLVDHQDSFVHTLANYLRQTGAEVTTLRAGFPADQLDALAPGPGRALARAGHARRLRRRRERLSALVGRGIPVFGVCLGLQGMVEHFGGALDVLDYPMHGKASRIRVVGGRLFEGLPKEFSAGRYHSLFAIRDQLPADLMRHGRERGRRGDGRRAPRRCRWPPFSSTRSRS